MPDPTSMKNLGSNLKRRFSPKHIFFNKHVRPFEFGVKGTWFEDKNAKQTNTNLHIQLVAILDIQMTYFKTVKYTTKFARDLIVAVMNISNKCGVRYLN